MRKGWEVAGELKGRSHLRYWRLPGRRNIVAKVYAYSWESAENDVLVADQWAWEIVDEDRTSNRVMFEGAASSLDSARREAQKALRYAEKVKGAATRSRP